MKKLMLVMLALATLVVADASANYYRNGGACGRRSCEPKVCKPACPKVCRPAVKVEEEAKPAPKCCVRYVRVEEPCQWTKHISWSCDCPSTCQQEGLKDFEVEYADAEKTY